MGFVDDQLSIFVQPSAFEKTEGTWTPGYAAQLVKEVRTAAATTGVLLIPLSGEAGAGYREGMRIKSVDVYYSVLTTALNNVTTVEIAAVTLAANATLPTGVVVASSIDSANDTTAKRLTATAHTMTVTPTADLWVTQGVALWLTMTYDAAAGSVISIYGARINYELRI